MEFPRIRHHALCLRHVKGNFVCFAGLIGWSVKSEEGILDRLDKPPRRSPLCRIFGNGIFRCNNLLHPGSRISGM